MGEWEWDSLEERTFVHEVEVVGKCGVDTRWHSLGREGVSWRSG